MIAMCIMVERINLSEFISELGCFMLLVVSFLWQNFVVCSRINPMPHFPRGRFVAYCPMFNAVIAVQKTCVPVAL